jgi:transcription-repair coupling factor (superfamily II helicase)
LSAPRPAAPALTTDPASAVALAAADPAAGPALTGLPRRFAGVAPPAQAYVAACLVRLHPGRRAWIVCQDLRHQERIHAELATWGVPSVFFPELERLPVAEAAGDPEIEAERLNVLRILADPADPRPLVLAARSLHEQVPAPTALESRLRVLETGATHDPATLAAELAAAGYEGLPLVGARGQFARRGGIFDVFPWHLAEPLRIEFFDDQIESIREFEIHSQTSTRRVPRGEILLAGEDWAATGRAAAKPLAEHRRPGELVLAIGLPLAIADATIDDELDLDGNDHPLASHGSPAGAFAAGDFLLSEAKHAGFLAQVRQWSAGGWRVAMLCHGEGEAERLRRLLDPDPDALAALTLQQGALAFGFTCPALRLAVLSAAELFGQFQAQAIRRRFNREAAQRRIRHVVDAAELEDGDMVVHAEYGIARYRGLGMEETQGGRREVMVLEFAAKARLFVPIDQSHLVSRYVGIGNKAPELSKLGDARWARLRKRAETEIHDFAGQLLKVQAERQSETGRAHPPDTRWQWEFENAFPYRETPDQITSISQVKADMESPRPMDRLLCGDVGFGKTEVALRAAFKAVMGGSQVAILVPTTVLAQQHFDTFRQRMSAFPVRVEMLCRLQSPAEQRVVASALAAGAVDIVIGTHRLVSPDISFKDLGLVVIDEEQRFGVRHKEQFKELFRLVDVLTLSATPIPRTLYLSLTGVREMSVIETPPPSRLPVRTSICHYDERVIREAIAAELARGGQVFFLHNRVRTIHKVKERVEALVPGARALVGHGQMDRRDLEDVMHAFVRRDADVLVATTIIESGIDIPNANTIIIDRADLFGLADLYQLRGRVGRSEHKAYAYLMLPPRWQGAGDARKRLSAMKEYSALGSGFKVAMRDLEIRGAGSMLGTEQSGHIANIGFDLYCQLLRHSLGRLSGRQTGQRVDVVLHAPGAAFSETAWAASPGLAPAFLPKAWIEDPAQRVTAYRALAEAATHRELRALEKSWRDRYGRPPAPVANLLVAQGVKIAAALARIAVVEIRDNTLRLTRNGEFILLDGKFPRLAASDPAATLREALDWLKRI